MFKTGLTKAVFDQFISSFNPPKKNQKSSETPLIYVDGATLRYITDSYDSGIKTGGVFAATLSRDGERELLAIY